MSEIITVIISSNYETNNNRNLTFNNKKLEKIESVKVPNSIRIIRQCRTQDSEEPDISILSYTDYAYCFSHLDEKNKKITIVYRTCQIEDTIYNVCRTIKQFSEIIMDALESLNKTLYRKKEFIIEDSRCLGIILYFHNGKYQILTDMIPRPMRVARPITMYSTSTTYPPF